MKLFIVLVLFIMFIDSACSQKTVSPLTTPDAVLYSVYQKLTSLKNLKYNSKRECNYSSENYRDIQDWTVYFDFKSTDTLIGLKYQIEDLGSKQVFNGTEKFELNKKAHTIQINVHPDARIFSGHSTFYNSLVTLKNMLPLIINDKTVTKAIADTTVNNIPYSLVTINIGKRRIQNLGNGFDNMTTKSNFIYKILIRKNDDFPFEVLQVNDLNSDFIKTNFTNIEVNTNPPTELSWYYPTYTIDYKPAAEITPQLLSNGSLAPEWKLEVYNMEKNISLNDLKGKVVLLDFWIKNCGPCIESVPHLNELQNKFKNRNFEIISINSYDSKEDISWFCNKHNTAYTVLANGKAIAEKYGVGGFPAFFVIDKEGKVIYSSAGYDESFKAKIEKIIENAL